MCGLPGGWSFGGGGRANVAVLRVLVWDAPITSLPAKISVMAFACMGVGFSGPDSVTAERTAWESPRSENDIGTGVDVLPASVKVNTAMY